MQESRLGKVRGKGRSGVVTELIRLFLPAFQWSRHPNRLYTAQFTYLFSSTPPTTMAGTGGGRTLVHATNKASSHHFPVTRRTTAQHAKRFAWVDRNKFQGLWVGALVLGCVGMRGSEGCGPVPTGGNWSRNAMHELGWIRWACAADRHPCC
jgi:hypothetical protein